MCAKHHRRWRLHGDPLIGGRDSRSTCTVVDDGTVCGRIPVVAKGKGLNGENECSMHWQQRKNTGAYIRRFAGEYDWQHLILPRADEIIRSYHATEPPTEVTLRQVYYRLVSEQLIKNEDQAYKTFARLSAIWRKDGRMADTFDPTREIHRMSSWTSPADGLEAIAAQYRRDRTEGQEYNVFIGCEKAGQVEQLRTWFNEPLGLPVLAFKGYSSVPYVKDIIESVETDGRPAVLLYAGDFDCSGENIFDTVVRDSDCWHDVIKVAVSLDQVATYGLVRNKGKTKKNKDGIEVASDTRAAKFIEKYADPLAALGWGDIPNPQVELDALDPNDLRALFFEALTPLWDFDTSLAVVREEVEERALLSSLGGFLPNFA